jgi:hypothetical protein
MNIPRLRHAVKLFLAWAEIFPSAPEMTIIQYLNSVIDKTFTFMDPISKLSAKGNKATFQDSAVYDDMLTQLFIVDREDRLWYPPATKVFLIGWKFLESMSPGTQVISSKPNTYGAFDSRTASGLLARAVRIIPCHNCLMPISA